MNPSITEEIYFKKQYYGNDPANCNSQLRESTVTLLETRSFIKVRDQYKTEKISDFKIAKIATYQSIWDAVPLNDSYLMHIDKGKYWVWNISSRNLNPESWVLSSRFFGYHNFETYKQLKTAAKEIDPDISKEEIYEELLRPFRHQKLRTWDPHNNRYRISYVCKYENCNKEFIKTWNLLDHVRIAAHWIYPHYPR